MDIFHVAIPAYDLDQTEAFYTTVLGARRARRYEDRVTFRFFDHQLVCHLMRRQAAAAEPESPFDHVYPRHFGITFDDESRFDSTHAQCVHSGWRHVQPVSARFADRPERHKTFFLADPSHNIIEFKYYFEQELAY